MATSMPVKDLAENATLTVISRFAMIGATIALPLFGWSLNRAVSTVDEIDKKIAVIHDRTLETNGTVKLIQQTESAQTAILSDHETRMRVIEHMLNGKPPIP